MDEFTGFLQTLNGAPSSGPPAATTVCQPRFLKCANGKQTGRSGQLQPALMEINGLFIRAEFRWHRGRPIALVLYLAASRRLLCSLFEIWLHAHAVLTVSRLELIAETMCYAPVTMPPHISSQQSQTKDDASGRLREHFTGCLNASSPAWENKRFVSFC